MLRANRATSCNAPHAAAAAANLGVSQAGAYPVSWRHRVEIAAAHAAGIPLLDAAYARQQRWDLHPGLQGGASGSVGRLSHRYDCAHVSLSPGAFDAELIALETTLSGL